MVRIHALNKHIQELLLRFYYMQQKQNNANQSREKDFFVYVDILKMTYFVGFNMIEIIFVILFLICMSYTIPSHR